MSDNKLQYPKPSTQFQDEINKMVWIGFGTLIISLFPLSYLNFVQEWTSLGLSISVITLLACYTLYLYKIYHTQIRKGFTIIKDIREYKEICNKMVTATVVFEVTIVNYKISPHIQSSVVSRIFEKIYPDTCIEKNGFIGDFPRKKPFVFVFSKAFYYNSSKQVIKAVEQRVKQTVDKNKGEFLHSYKYSPHLQDSQHVVCYSLCGYDGKWLGKGYAISAILGLVVPYMLILQWMFVEAYDIRFDKEIGFNKKQKSKQKSKQNLLCI